MSNSNYSSEAVKAMSPIKREGFSWTFNIGHDIGGGIVATLALLPEVMGFMLSIGIPPFMGLFTCIVLTVTLSIVGGRPGVITACAGATATICTGLISKYFIGGEHPEYLFAVVILAGIIQIILGLLKFGNLIKVIPETIMNGFVNGLASLILISQIRMILKEQPTQMGESLVWIAIGVGIIIAFSLIQKFSKIRFLQYIPAPIVCVVVVSLIVIFSGRPIMRIQDLGAVAFDPVYIGSIFSNLGNIFTGQAMAVIIPTALSIAFIGLVETLFTSRFVTEQTNTPELSNINRECRGQGIGNIICGILGTMPGCAMIAPSNANVKSGGKGRVSSLATGITMAALLFGLSSVLRVIPMAALIAVMLYICFETFNWDSILKAGKKPVLETITMATVVVVVIATDNLAFGVIAGLIVWYVSLAFKLFSGGLISNIVSFGLAALALALISFNPGTAIAVLLAALGVGLGSSGKDSYGGYIKSGRAAIIINYLIFAAGILMIILNTFVFKGSMPWYHIGH